VLGSCEWSDEPSGSGTAYLAALLCNVRTRVSYVTDMSVLLCLKFL
jgi:hypothetical protein